MRDSFHKEYFIYLELVLFYRFIVCFYIYIFYLFLVGRGLIYEPPILCFCMGLFLDLQESHPWEGNLNTRESTDGDLFLLYYFCVKNLAISGNLEELLFFLFLTKISFLTGWAGFKNPKIISDQFFHHFSKFGKILPQFFLVGGGVQNIQK